MVGHKHFMAVQNIKESLKKQKFTRAPIPNIEKEPIQEFFHLKTNQLQIIYIHTYSSLYKCTLNTQIIIILT